MNKLFTAGILALLVAPALAAGPVNLRQAKQERRIDAGVRSGKLTRAEAARLKAEQRSIARLEDQLRARHRGRLTERDKQIIHRRQQMADTHILGQKRDAQRGRNKLPF